MSDLPMIYIKTKIQKNTYNSRKNYECRHLFDSLRSHHLESLKSAKYLEITKKIRKSDVNHFGLFYACLKVSDLPMIYGFSDVCTCADCQDSDYPCANDCDPSERCEGCNENHLEQQDNQFEIDQAQGRRFGPTSICNMWGAPREWQGSILRSVGGVIQEDRSSSGFWVGIPGQ